MSFQNLLFYFLIFIGFLPLIFYFIKGSKNISYIRFLLPFLSYIFLASFYEFIFTDLLNLNSTAWFRFSKILQFFSLSYFYFKLLGRKKLFIFFAILFILNYLYLIYQWIFYPAIGFNIIHLNVIITLLVLISSIIWIIDAFKKMEEVSFYINPLFYIIASILLYYCSTFIVFVVTDYMKQHKMKIRDFYMIVYYANFLLRGTLVVVLWRASRTKPSFSS